MNQLSLPLQKLVFSFLNWEPYLEQEPLSLLSPNVFVCDHTLLYNYDNHTGSSDTLWSEQREPITVRIDGHGAPDDMSWHGIIQTVEQVSAFRKVQNLQFHNVLVAFNRCRCVREWYCTDLPTVDHVSFENCAFDDDRALSFLLSMTDPTSVSFHNCVFMRRDGHTDAFKHLFLALQQNVRVSFHGIVVYEEDPRVWVPDGRLLKGKDHDDLLAYWSSRFFWLR